MAAGSHAEKGIWALFVNLAITIVNLVSVQEELVNEEDKGKFMFPINLKATPSIISESPTRLLRAVNIPALYDTDL